MRKLLLPTTVCLAIAACGDGQSSPAGEATATKAQDTADRPSGDADAGGDARRETASIGPLSYSYDPAILRQTEVRTALPPDYEREQSGTKLVPVERAELLGEEECRYGESGMVSTCTAEQEAGVAFVRLDGSLSQWRDTFAESMVGTGPLEDAEIGGVQGFRFTAQVEGSGAEYNFLPAGDSTILVERRFRHGREEGVEEVAKVIDNLRVSR